jgi:hypothetical protein
MTKTEFLADIISKLFSPISIALMVTLIFSIFSPIGLGSIGLIESIIIGILFIPLFPLLFIIYFYTKGKVDIYVSDRETRTLLYLFAICGYIISSIIFYFTDTKIMFILSIAYISVTTTVMFSNLFTKVSSHTAGISGPLTALIYVYGVKLLPLYVLILIVMWARIRMNAHTYIQLIEGVIISITVTYLVYFFLW